MAGVGGRKIKSKIKIRGVGLNWNS